MRHCGQDGGGLWTKLSIMDHKEDPEEDSLFFFWFLSFFIPPFFYFLTKIKWKDLAEKLRTNTREERTIPVQTSPAHHDPEKITGDQTSSVQTITAQRYPEKTTGDQTSSVQTITAQHGTAVSVYYSNNVFHGPADTTVRAESKQPGGRATSTKAQHEDSTDTAAADAQRRAESQKLKSNIIDRYAELYEGTTAKGKHNLLNDVYTELYIVKDWTGGVNTDHEVIQVEARPARHAATDAAVKFSEVFSGSQRVKKVLTLGIAGIGKTVSVRKFAVDWAEGESNADIDFVFIIPFRELNLLKDEEYSLPELLLYFYPEQQLLKEPGLFGGECNCVFIFDGLDEFRSPLSFGQKKISAVTEKASVNVLVTSLITGTLYPSARVWITSRPAAADQIPSNYIHLLTEVQGFVTDQQKEEYFRKRISMERKEKTNEDQDEDKIMISLIKKSKTLYIMCYIPVFCWITYTVLQHNKKHHNPEELKSLTQMYTHFLTIQMETKREKDNQTPQKDTKNLLESNRTILLKLAELAFKQLMKGNVMFYEEDLRESSIDVTEAAVYSGIFTEFFKEESEFQQRKIYSFVHLSFQEFLAAVYVFHCYENKNMEELEILNSFKPVPLGFYDQQNRRWSENDSLDEVLKEAVDNAVACENGHLDLFLRFLLGISLETNQRCLQGLLTTTQSSSEEIREHIKRLIRDYQVYTERSFNLFLCLSEMNDQSVSRELQEYLNSEGHSEEILSPGQCSALTYMILSSGEVLDELDLKKYNTSDESYRRLIPAVTVCRKARLAGCNLTKDSCETLCSALHSANSPLRELDLSNNDLQDSGVELLSAGLKSSDCKLEALRLVTCNIGQKACENLASALQSANSSLTKLDLSYNDLQDSGVELLSAGLRSSDCKLENLGLAGCNLTKDSCETLCSALQSANSPLKELDLSNNDLQDSGVELLSAGLRSSHCKLEKLGLSGCMVTVTGCSHLASALKSNPSHLKELDLRYNHPGESGVKMLSELKEDPHYALEILRADHGGQFRMKPGLKKYAVRLTLDLNTAHRRLSLSEGNRKDYGFYSFWRVFLTTSHLSAALDEIPHFADWLPNIVIQRCTALTPASLFLTEDEGEPHDCVALTDQLCSANEDLKEDLLDNPDLILYVDGSASRNLDGAKFRWDMLW
ncbi:hypothetical protein MHYP_G00018700 [Metynnis hypsauchen]